MKTQAATRSKYIAGATAAIAELAKTGILTATEAAGNAEPTPVKVVGTMKFAAVDIRPLAKVAKSVKAIGRLDKELVELETGIATIGATLTAANPVKLAAQKAGKALIKALPFENLDEAAAWAEKNMRLTDAKNEAAALVSNRDGMVHRQREVETEFLEHVSYVANELFGPKENAALEKLALCSDVSFSVLRKV